MFQADVLQKLNDATEALKQVGPSCLCATHSCAVVRVRRCLPLYNIYCVSSVVHRAHGLPLNCRVCCVVHDATYDDGVGRVQAMGSNADLWQGADGRIN